jgi:hypothetical protein
MSDPEKKQQNTGELTNNELEGVQGGMMIPVGTRFENSQTLKTSPTLTKTAEAADQNSDQSPLF